MFVTSHLTKTNSYLRAGARPLPFGLVPLSIKPLIVTSQIMLNGYQRPIPMENIVRTHRGRNKKNWQKFATNIFKLFFLE